ncbi:hypothetical protein [Flagellimonas olearia]|uniref:Uncharacterized protein n=1 Tax=Flagellimonas olearia TaxID=552546 RepID=A0A444VLV7_9FLAO|nr:hypothetical protein [Allomuricauda olearia]RYC51753.1 hypothetical protein DN53_13070 [Allomuricauda olearia]
MKRDEAIKTLNNLYGLLMEINYHKLPEDYIEELNDDNDFIKSHLRNVLRQRAIAKGILNQNRYNRAYDEFIRIKKMGVDKLKELIPQQDMAELVPLFSKFEELDEKDKKAIAEDEEFLIFISALKDKIERGELD